MGIPGEKHVVALLPEPNHVVEENECMVLIDGEVRRVKIGRRSLQVGCHYVMDEAFEEIYRLYRKVRGGGQ